MTALKKQMLPIMLLLAAWLIVLTSCGSAKSEPEQPRESTELSDVLETPPTAAPTEGTYVAPPMAETTFHEAPATEPGQVVIDRSECGKGYIGVSATHTANCRLPEVDLVIKLMYDADETTYTHLPADGTPVFLPLSQGDGTYLIRIMEYTDETSGCEIYREEVKVTLDDEFEPFIRSTYYCPYDASSKCVALGAELAAQSEDVVAYISNVFDYVKDNITYDRDRAMTVKYGYLTDPDETLTKGSGICMDYASLVAALLRSQGIPTKIVEGYVNQNGEDMKHAWNMFYTPETGWVTVEYKVSGESWSRLDLTFSAGSDDSTFVENNRNYSDLRFY